MNSPRQILHASIKQADAHLADPGADLRTIAAQLRDTCHLVIAELRPTPIVHFARTSFAATCGSDVRNQHTTQMPEYVTCAACAKILNDDTVEISTMNFTGAYEDQAEPLRKMMNEARTESLTTTKGSD